MAGQSLYRKHRPQTFGALVGQEHVTRALLNAVRGRHGQGYLFSGPRGTGKTTTARLLAKALNCENLGDDGEPCNECQSCRAITEGSSLDVIELDAASNNGVDAMRDLIGRVAYRSAGGRMKVYIVDEVHMLSTGASNALLKTLEEPPEHVVFVLATTDPQKVLPTIRSRVQPYQFSLLSTEQLTAQLQHVLELEGVEADPEAVRLVARRGAGSARDALSLLDQALAHGNGRLDLEDVQRLFEASPFERRAALFDALVAEDAAGALVIAHGLLETGVEARQLADELLRHLRDMFLVAATRGAIRVDRPEEELERLQAQGAAMGAGAVQRAIETLGAAVADMIRAPDPRLVLEVVLVRLARRELGSGYDALVTRIERLEQQLGGDHERVRTPRAVPSDQSLEAPDEMPDGDPPPRPRPRVAAEPKPGSAPPPSTAAAAAARQPAVTSAGELSPDAPVGGTSPAAGARAALGAFRKTGTASRTRPEPTADDPAASEPPRGQSTSSAAARASAPSEDHSDGADEFADETPPALDDVILAWPRAIETLQGRLQLAACEMQPIGIDERGRVLFGLPSLHQRNLSYLKEQRSAVAGALAVALGRSIGFEIVIDDALSRRGEVVPAATAPVTAAPDTPPPVGRPGRQIAPRAAPVGSPRSSVGPPSGERSSVEPSSAVPPVDEPDEIDLDEVHELEDAPADGAGGDPAVAMLQRLFDAEVIEERRHD